MIPTRSFRRRPQTISVAHVIAAAISIFLASACGSTVAPASPTGSPIVTPAPTPSPTSTTTPSPSAAIASPSASPACAISLDRVPAWDERFYVSGTGFAPGIDIKITFIDPGSTSTFGGPDGEVKPSLLHTSEAGTFGPWDLMYTEPTPQDFGSHAITASDGECSASADFQLSAP